MWKKIRISILSVALAYVCMGAYVDTHQNWDKPVKIVMHPINMDGQAETQKYIDSLSEKDFDEIEAFVLKKSAQYRSKPVEMDFVLAKQISNKPLLPTEDVANSMWRTMLWSLQFRFFGVWNFKSSDFGADTVMYLNYHNPKGRKSELERSTALERGRMAVVNLYAEDTRLNNPIVLHELLHTFGAEDQYDLFNGSPIFPLGYAEPNKKPLYPQVKAEVMGAYIPVNEVDFMMPNNLSDVVMSEHTAKTLGWVKKK